MAETAVEVALREVAASRAALADAEEQASQARLGDDRIAPLPPLPWRRQGRSRTGLPGPGRRRAST
jgi:hypothetical protein